MIRDCYTWRACLSLARKKANYTTQQAIWTLNAKYGPQTIERMDKTMLTEMVYRLMQEAGVEIQYADAGKGVELWYTEA